MALKVIGQNSDILKHYNNKRSFVGHFCRMYTIVDELFPRFRKAKRGQKLNLKLMIPDRMKLFHSEQFPHWIAWRDYCMENLGYTPEDKLFFEAVQNRQALINAGWSPIWDRGDWQRRR